MVAVVVLQNRNGTKKKPLLTSPTEAGKDLWYPPTSIGGQQGVSFLVILSGRRKPKSNEILRRTISRALPARAVQN
jgi:hypothetical protein